MGWRSMLMGLLVLSGAACTTASEDGALQDGAPPTVQSLAEVAAGSAAYELEVTSLGAVERRALLQPAPVGTGFRVEVTIRSGAFPDEGVPPSEGALSVEGRSADGTENTGDSEGSWVAGLFDVVVERSSADGSSDALRLTAVEFSGSDPLMAEALGSNVGVSLLAVRGPDKAVEVYEQTVDASDEEETNTQVLFWLDQLLRAPVAFAGPLPQSPLGEGAVWDVTFQSGDQDPTRDRFALSRLDSERYVIEGSSMESDNRLSVVLEGVVGGLLPDRQEIEITQGGTGPLVTTVVILSGS